ncbi:unnamed protein product, partial [Brassica rapa subsp. narinosa]
VSTHISTLALSVNCSCTDLDMSSSFDGLDCPTHVPYLWVNNPTLGEFCFTMIGRADIEGSKSNVTLGCHKLQIPKMCRPSQTPQLTISSARIDPPKRVLGLKEGVVTPPPNHRIPKEPFPVRPLADTRRSALTTLAAQAARQQSTGSELGPPSPALRANPFPKVTDPFCRLPLPTLFHRPETVHLGDLMRL